MWYVYVLQCQDGSLYTGCTNDVAARFIAHLNGKGARYTKAHKPKEIVYQESCDSRSGALKREAEIKKMSRKQKLDLVGGG